MVVFKENYDLTRRTPTPPAQRRQREMARKRLEQRQKHTAFQRGQFEARRRLTQYIESQKARGGDTRQLPMLRQGDDNDNDDHPHHTHHHLHDARKLSSSTSQHPFGSAAETTGTANYTNLHQYSAFGERQHYSGDLDRLGSGSSASLASFRSPTTGGNTASIRGGAGFLSLANAERNAHPWTMEPPALTNDSFSGFLGAQARDAVQHASASARAAVFETNQLVNSNFASSNNNNNNNTIHHRPGRLHRLSSSGIPEQWDPSGAEDIHSFLASSPRRNGGKNDDDDNDENDIRRFNPPCGFDTLDDQDALFEGEKRISGEDHFERYNFSKTADEIRVAATVREFKRLVVDKPPTTTTTGEGFSFPSGAASGGNFSKASPRTASSTFRNNNHNNNNGKFSPLLSASNLNSGANAYRSSGDPRDQQHIVEGLLGTHQQLLAPTNVEMETIRILREIQKQTANQSPKQNQNQNSQRSPPGRNDSRPTTSTSAEADPLTRRLAAGVTASRRRQFHEFGDAPGSSRPLSVTTDQQQQQKQHQQLLHHRISPWATSSSSSAEAGTLQKQQHQRVSPASAAVPRPPPDYYTKHVSGRGVRQAESMEEEKMKVAAQLSQKAMDDPNPLAHRPPFRLKGGNFGQQQQKHQKQQQHSQSSREDEEELENDIREDIRLFEWRRAAQEHARQQAKAAVVREKQLGSFRQRQAEHFRGALSRFEPGALQRAERAIQHRIAHELIAKYGSAQFMSSQANRPGDDGVIIPESYQVCAREAAVAAAEAARNQKIIQKYQHAEERLRRIDEMSMPREKTEGVSPTAATLVQQQQQGQQRQRQQQKRGNEETPPRPPLSPTTTARKPTTTSEVPPTKPNSTSRPHTAATTSREQYLIRNRTLLVATQGLAKPRKEYVDRDAIESSGYKSWGGSIFPKGVAACEASENDDFVASMTAVKKEIDELETRCPSLNLERIQQQLLLQNSKKSATSTT